MEFADLQEKVEGLSVELFTLFHLYFPKEDYPDIEISDDSLKNLLSVTVYQFFSDCNRQDMPHTAKIPLLRWLVSLLRYRVYITDVFSPTNPDLEKTERPTDRVDIKSTSVTYGKSESETLKSEKKQLYKELKKNLRDDWLELVVSYRKLRW